MSILNEGNSKVLESEEKPNLDTGWKLERVLTEREKVKKDLDEIIECEDDVPDYYPLSDFKSGEDLIYHSILEMLPLNMESKLVPFAGIVKQGDERLSLHINRKNYYNLRKRKWARGVLIHEALHVGLGHITMRFPKDINPDLWNAAVDLAVNSLIPRNLLPSFGTFAGEDKFEKYPIGLTAEQYLEMIKKDPQFDSEGDGMAFFGFEVNNHAEQWAGVFDNEMLEIKQTIKNTKPDEGSMNIVKRMLEGLNIHNFNIKNLINKLTSKSIVTRQRKQSVRFRNRKNKLLPGIKRNSLSSSVVIFVDQSASVNDELCKFFLSAATKINKYTPIEIYSFDSSVNPASHKKYDIRRFKGKYPRLNNGWTNFESVVQFANKHCKNIDVVILTDFDADVPVTKSKNKIYWVVDEESFIKFGKDFLLGDCNIYTFVGN